MRLYLDTEFDGLGGPLISMALVSEEGEEWYEVMPVKPVHPWVIENVMPKLGREPLANLHVFRQRLGEFLAKYDGCEIVADWPADIQHLCDQMSYVGADLGFRIPIQATFSLILGSPTITPENPHNALSDAHALRVWHQSTLKA